MDAIWWLLLLSLYLGVMGLEKLVDNFGFACQLLQSMVTINQYTVVRHMKNCRKSHSIGLRNGILPECWISCALVDGLVL